MTQKTDKSFEAQHGKKPNQKLKPYLVQQYLLLLSGFQRGVSHELLAGKGIAPTIHQILAGKGMAEAVPDCSIMLILRFKIDRILSPKSVKKDAV